MKLRALLLFTGLLATGGLLAHADDWPQWRGPDRTDVSKEKGLLQDWPANGPKLLWTYKDAGVGLSGPAIVGNRLYTLGARGKKDEEMEYVIALDVAKGTEVWAKKIGPMFTFGDNVWGDGPRSTPTVDGDHLYALGGQGELVCLKSADGAEVWRVNLSKDLGGKAAKGDDLDWGYTESPLVDGDQLICTPGGAKGAMVALDKLTGKPLWRSTELKDETTYGSAVVADVGGVRQYIRSTFNPEKGRGGIAGMAAATGKVLWYFPHARYKNLYAIAMTPVVQGDLVYVSAGDSAGCNLLKLTKNGELFKEKDQYAKNAQKEMANDHGGVVLVGDHVYGHSKGKGLVCQEFTTGKVVWSEKSKLETKSLSLTYADNRLYLYTEEGEAVLVAATPTTGYQEQGRFTIPEKAPRTKTSNQAGTWTHPVVANGRLYLRDQGLLFCYQVK